MEWRTTGRGRSNAPSGSGRPTSPRSRSENASDTSTAASTAPSRINQAIGSHVETNLEDVTVFDFVLLAFHPELPRILGCLPRPQLEELLPTDHLGSNEAPGQVRVDHPGALGRLRPGPEGPGPALLVTRGQERSPPQQVVGGPGHPGQGALAEAETFQQFGPLVLVELGRFGLQLDADAEHLAGIAELVGN